MFPIAVTYKRITPRQQQQESSTGSPHPKQKQQQEQGARNNMSRKRKKPGAGTYSRSASARAHTHTHAHAHGFQPLSHSLPLIHTHRVSFTFIFIVPRAASLCAFARPTMLARKNLKNARANTTREQLLFPQARVDTATMSRVMKSMKIKLRAPRYRASHRSIDIFAGCVAWHRC